MKKIKTEKVAQSHPNEWVNSTNHESIVPMRDLLEQVVTQIDQLGQTFNHVEEEYAYKAGDALDNAKKHILQGKDWLEDVGFNLTPEDNPLMDMEREI